MLFFAHMFFSVFVAFFVGFGIHEGLHNVELAYGVSFSVLGFMIFLNIHFESIRMNQERIDQNQRDILAELRKQK